MPRKPRYRGHPAVYVISIALFLVVAVGAILLTRGYTVDVHTGALKKTGLLVLGSIPEEAYITIDEDIEDVRTRSRLTLTPGSYGVTVDLPNTHPWQKRIDIAPGKAVIEEDILLFQDKPNRVALTDGPVAGFSLDATARRLAYLQAGPDGVGVFIRNVDRKDQPRRITLLPPNYASPTSFSWSNDGSRVAASVAGETRIIPIDGGTPATVPVGGRTALSPGQSDVLLAEPTPGTIVRIQPNGTVEPIESGVTTWTTTDDAAYLAKPDGSVTRVVRNDKREVGNGSAQVELLSAPGTDRAFGRTADGTVTAFSDGSPEKILTEADRFAPARGGEQIMYVTERELRLWNGSEQTDDLLTRFTDVPTQLGVLPGGNYALFGSGSTIDAIAADGSNTTELTASDSLLNVIDLETLLVRDGTGRLVGLEILKP